MARASQKRPQLKSPHSKKQQQVLKALETAARRQGLKVSVGQLRVAGLRLKGGSCLLRGRQWIILDRYQPFDDLIEVYRQALSLDSLAGLGLGDELVELIAPYLDQSSSGAPDRAA